MGVRSSPSSRPQRKGPSLPLCERLEHFPLRNKANMSDRVEAPEAVRVALPSASAFVPPGQSVGAVRGPERRPWVSASWFTVLARALLFLEKRLRASQILVHTGKWISRTQTTSRCSRARQAVWRLGQSLRGVGQQPPVLTTPPFPPPLAGWPSPALTSRASAAHLLLRRSSRGPWSVCQPLSV